MTLPSKERIATALRRRFFLRVHMFVIVGGTVAVGLLTTKILLMTHERNLAFRYGVAVIVAFAAFLGFIKLWLGYVGRCLARKTSSGDGGDWLDVVDFDCDGVSGGGPQFESGGGSSFGGGGAGGSWGESNVAAAPVKSSGGGFSLGDLGCDDDLGMVILVALLVLAIAAAAVYVIWAAPAILTEAAFQGALAAALTRRAKKISHGTWQGSVIRATVLPFAIVLLFAVALGWYAQKHCPSAMRLREAVHCIV